MRQTLRQLPMLAASAAYALSQWLSVISSSINVCQCLLGAAWGVHWMGPSAFAQCPPPPINSTASWDIADLFRHLGTAPTTREVSKGVAKVLCGPTLLVTRHGGLLFGWLLCFRGCFLCIGLIYCAVEVNFCPCFSRFSEICWLALLI